jgi:uncharacterized protein with PIN domain
VRVRVRCYAELNEFLPTERRQREIEVDLGTPAPVRHLIVNLGIPPTEVELVLINGVSCALEAGLEDGDRVALYPVFESLDVSPVLRLRRRPLRSVRFIADAHLGGLARYLRLLGFDTLFANDLGDGRLAAIAAEEGRIVLSRDRNLLMRRAVTHGLYVPQKRPREQVRYVLDRLDLYRLMRPFTRCTVCSGALIGVAKVEVETELPPRVLEVFHEFWRCAGCGRVYWKGSHYDRLHAFVAQLAAAGSGRDAVVSE